jgi:hypothetical protein
MVLENDRTEDTRDPPAATMPLLCAGESGQRWTVPLGKLHPGRDRPHADPDGNTSRILMLAAASPTARTTFVEYDGGGRRRRATGPECFAM